MWLSELILIMSTDDTPCKENIFSYTVYSKTCQWFLSLSLLHRLCKYIGISLQKLLGVWVLPLVTLTIYITWNLLWVVFKYPVVVFHLFLCVNDVEFRNTACMKGFDVISFIFFQWRYIVNSGPNVYIFKLWPVLHPRGCLLALTTKATTYLYPLLTVCYVLVSSQHCLSKFKFQISVLEAPWGECQHQTSDTLKNVVLPWIVIPLWGNPHDHEVSSFLYLTN